MNPMLPPLLFGVGSALLAVVVARLLRDLRLRHFHPALPWPMRLAQTLAVRLLPEPGRWMDRPALQPLIGSLERTLRLAGLSPALRARDWIALLAACGLQSAVLMALLCCMTVALGMRPAAQNWILSGAVVGAALPQQWLRGLAREREAALLRELSAGLELLALSLECGCALSPALEVAARHLAAGPLQDILRSLQADLAAGRGRAAALRRLFEQHQGSVIAPTLGALVQAEAAGSSLAPVLRAQSRQRAEERFSAAEKAALQAPVRMLLPLIACIFPCTFIIIAFPLVTRFLQ